MIFLQCPNCGAENFKDSLFCSLCNTRFESIVNHSFSKPTLADTNSYKPIYQKMRFWGMICHFSALAGLIIPYGNFFVPLIFWLMKRRDANFVDEQGKESLKFQLSIIIYHFALDKLSLLTLNLYIINYMIAALVVYQVLVVIIASIAAYRGNKFYYPLNLFN